MFKASDFLFSLPFSPSPRLFDDPQKTKHMYMPIGIIKSMFFTCFSLSLDYSVMSEVKQHYKFESIRLKAATFLSMLCVLKRKLKWVYKTSAFNVIMSRRIPFNWAFTSHVPLLDGWKANLLLHSTPRSAQTLRSLIPNTGQHHPIVSYCCEQWATTNWKTSKSPVLPMKVQVYY